MNKTFLMTVLLLGLSSFALAENKPNHYGDWDVTVDKVIKKTTLIHQHRPHGEGVPGMGDSFSLDTFHLEYSFEAVFMGNPGDKDRKITYYLLFDNPLQRKITPETPLEDRDFKYSSATEFTLVLDDQNQTLSVDNYHSGQFGDVFVGMHPYEEIRVPLTESLLKEMLSAKVVAGNLSSEDKDANKSFIFDKTFKDILNAFLYRVNELKVDNAK